MKTKLLILSCIAAFTMSCKNSHDPGNGDDGASGRESGYDTSGDADAPVGTANDTTSLNGRTPAGSTTNEAEQQSGY